MFVDKGKINTSRFFFLCCIMRNLQKNLTIIWNSPNPPILSYTPPFSSKNFQTSPISVNIEKVDPPPPLRRWWGVFELRLVKRNNISTYQMMKVYGQFLTEF